MYTVLGIPRLHLFTAFSAVNWCQPVIFRVWMGWSALTTSLTRNI
ncbi:MAG: hypothetical protein QF537_09695 [SAR324 cluster bacterium]|nr:hypothetical protein [SAR324 cluster bacterium]